MVQQGSKRKFEERKDCGMYQNVCSTALQV